MSDLIIKPIREWLEELPEPAKSLALRNFDVYFERHPEIKVMRTSLAESLSCAFPWHRTKQGTEYWLDLYTAYLENLIPRESTSSSNSLSTSENVLEQIVVLLK